MDRPPPYFDPHRLAPLKGLRLRAQHLVEGFVSGLHRSPLAGFSVEFAEHRDYVPGDDLRYLDWKLFARREKYCVKRFEDETNLCAYLALDTSESMTYRGDLAPLSKLEYGQTLSAALMWLILHQQDAVAISTFDSQVRQVLRPTSDVTQTKALLGLYERIQPTGRTRFREALHELAGRWKKRGIVLIVSDLLDEPATIMAGLSALTARHHDVVVWHLVDPWEADFPFAQPLRLQGLEGFGSRDVDGRLLQRAYRQEYERHCKTLQSRCRGLGIEYLRVMTNEPCDRPLIRFLQQRMNRIR